MFTGAITNYIDVAQLTLYAFWFFFAGLIWYLHQEDKREGYPLSTPDRSGRVVVQGLPPIPAPKTFLMRDGSLYQAPPGLGADTRPIAAEPVAPWPGAPLRPTGNPLVDGVGPAAWAERSEHPDMTSEGENLMAPLRVAKDFFVESRDPDPRGYTVVAADGRSAGTIRDLWIDRSEPQIRYLEVTLPGGDNVMLPIHYARIRESERQVRVVAINSAQFADVPRLKNPDEISLREEDKVTAYFGGGHLYATPMRSEPIL